jgi:hypothetical protein
VSMSIDDGFEIYTRNGAAEPRNAAP